MTGKVSRSSAGRFVGALFAAALLCLWGGSPATAQMSDEGSWAGLLRYAVQQLNTPGEFEIELGRIESRDGGETFIASLEIRDDQGPWLTAEALSVVWDSSAALTGEARFPRVAAERFEIARAPVTRGDPPSAEDPEAGLEFAWPRPPIALSIGEIEIGEAVLGAPLLGEEIVARIEGAFSDAGDQQTARLRLARTDDAPRFEAALDSDYDFAADRLTLTLETSEAAGGVVGRLIGAPGASALNARVTAEGGAAGLDVATAVAAEETIDGRLSGRVRWAPAIGATLSGRIETGPSAPEWARAATEGGASVALDFETTTEGLIDIQRFALEGPALSASAAGQIDRGADRIDLRGEARSPQPDALAGLAGLSALAGLELSFEATGRASAPDSAFRGTLDGVEGAFGAIEGVRIAATTEAAEQGDGGAFAFDLATSGAALSNPNLAALIGAAPTAAARGAWGEGRLRIDRAAVVGALMSLDGSGATRDADDRFDGTLRLDLQDAGPAFALGGLAGEGRAALTIAASGVSGEGFESIGLDGGLSDLVFEDEALASLVGPSVRLALTVSETVEADGARRFTLSDAAATTASLGITADGWVGRSADQIDLAARLEALDPDTIGELAGIGFDEATATVRLAGLRSAPSVALDAAVEAPSQPGLLQAERLAARATAALRRDERTPFAARVRLEGAAFEAPALAGSVGSDPVFEAEGMFDRAISALTLDRATLDGRTVTLSAAGSARFAALGAEPPSVDLALEGAASDLSAFGPAQGSAGFNARLFGALADPSAEATVSAPRIRGLGPAIDEVTIALEASGLVSGPKAQTTVAGRLAGEPLALRATAEVRGAEGGASEISVALQQLSHRGASGSGSAALRDGVAEGRFRLDAPDLSRFAGLAGADLTGSARATLALSRSRGAQAIALESEALGFAAGPDGTADRVSARVAGRADAPSIALSAEGLSVAGLRDATAELEGGLRLGDATAFTARALSLRNRDLDLRLAGPTTATARGGTVSVAETTLLVNDGRIVGRGVVGRTADVAVAVENLPLDLLSTLDLAPVATGRLSGEARLDSGRAQSGVAVFSIEDVGVGRSGERLSEAELFDLRLDGRWDGRAVAASLALQPEGADPLRVEARVPAAGAPFPSIRPDAPVEGAIRWSGDVAALWPIVPVEDVDLSGALAVDLALSGTLDAPALGGRAELEDGRLLVVASGTDLRALNAEITPESDGRVRIVGTATDAEGETPGRLTLEGVVDPAGETAIAITARDAVLVRRDDAAARLDLDVEARVGGAAPVIRGAALVKEAEFRLIGEGATQPPLIEVQIEGEERRRARPEPARPIALDLTVRAPERVFVRGRGLESEWGGELAIGGTVADPSVVGEIAARRGRFTFAGAPFLLDGSTVRFTGPPDPLLDVRLTRRTDAVAGAIAVTGAASAPELAFSSTPALPEDEILPQLIFGRPLAQLTAVEAAQIASGLAALTSGRPGALDAARELVGVDTLDVDQGADGSARLRAGRYVAPGVFVEGRQGVEPGDQSVAVEIEITPEVRLESEAGRDGEPSVGVEWRRDY